MNTIPIEVVATIRKETVRKWLEYSRDEWEGTILHTEKNNDGTLRAEHPELHDENIGKIPVNVVATIRRETGGKKDGVVACALVVDQDLSERDVRKARDIVN